MGLFNSMFITLIPKKQDKISFGDFCPIFLCNVIYKIVAKILARRLQQIFSEIISEE
jgi:hypothetical protein